MRWTEAGRRIYGLLLDGIDEIHNQIEVIVSDQERGSEGRRSEQGYFVGRRRSPPTGVAAGVRGGHCSRYSGSTLTSGVLGLGGDLNDLPLEWVLEVWGHVRVVGATKGILWGGVGALPLGWLRVSEEDTAAGIQAQR